MNESKTVIQGFDNVAKNVAASVGKGPVVDKVRAKNCN